MTHTITDQNAKQLIQQHHIALIDCWAPWCGPCRQIAPIIDQLAKEFHKKALIGKLNIDDNPNFLKEYPIKSIPTLLLFKNGKQVHQMIGLQPLETLKKTINQLLNQ